MNPSGNISLWAPKLVCGEGKDEKVFLEALFRAEGIRDVQVLEIGRYTASVKLESIMRDPGFPDVRSIGILRDADEDASAAFSSVCSALSGASLPVPRRELEVAAGPPRVVALVLPGDGRPGSLESLCRESMATDRATGCVDAYFGCLARQGIAERPLENGRAKAWAQAFLASRSEEVLRVGEAAEKGVWDLSSPSFKGIRQLLQLL